MMIWNAFVLTSVLLAALMTLSADSVDSEGFKDELRITTVVNQLTLANHSSLLSEHSKELTNIANALSQQQNHDQVLNDLNQRMQSLSESLLEVKRDQTESVSQMTQVVNQSITAILEVLAQQQQNHSKAINELNQGMQSLSESMTEVKRDQTESVSQLAQVMNHSITATLEVLTQQQQGNSKAFNDLNQGMQSLSESVIQDKTKQTESVSELTQAINHSFTPILETLTQQQQGHSIAINDLKQGMQSLSESLIEVKTDQTSSMTPILKALTQQQQDHSRAISDLSQGMQNLSESLLQINLDQTRSINQMTQTMNRSITDILSHALNQQRKDKLSHSKAISDLSQDIKDFSYSFIHVKEEQSACAKEMMKIMNISNTKLLDGLFQQKMQCRNHSYSIGELSQRMLRFLGTLTQVKAELSVSINQMTEIMNASNASNAKVCGLPPKGLHSMVYKQSKHDLVQRIRDISEALIQITYEALSQQDCVKENGEVVNHGDTFKYGCDIITCESGNLRVIDRQTSVPQDFQTVSDGCFLPVQMYKTWDEARNYCRALGSDLPKPPSDLEALKLFLNNQTISFSSWWIGGKKRTDGEFIYLMDDTSVDPNHWFQGSDSHPLQPDCVTGECCLYIGSASDPPLYDASCGHLGFFICQCGSCDTMNVFATLAVVLAAFGQCSSLSCLPCDEIACRNPSYCPYGTVPARCGCCLKCAKGPGEKCGGYWHIEGVCGENLFCQPDPSVDENKFLHESIKFGNCVAIKTLQEIEDPVLSLLNVIRDSLQKVKPPVRVSRNQIGDSGQKSLQSVNVPRVEKQHSRKISVGVPEKYLQLLRQRRGKF